MFSTFVKAFLNLTLAWMFTIAFINRWKYLKSILLKNVLCLSQWLLTSLHSTVSLWVPSQRLEDHLVVHPPTDLCHLTFNASWHSNFQRTGGSSADNGGQALSDPTRLSKVKLAWFVLWLQRSQRKRYCAHRMLQGIRRWSISLVGNSQNNANFSIVERCFCLIVWCGCSAYTKQKSRRCKVLWCASYCIRDFQRYNLALVWAPSLLIKQTNSSENMLMKLKPTFSSLYFWRKKTSLMYYNQNSMHKCMHNFQPYEEWKWWE